MDRLLRFPSAVKRDQAIEAWMHEHSGELGAIAQQWFEVARNCGADVRELLHDGHPTACVEDMGKFMRHVKLRPECEVDASALMTLIETAYADMKSRLTEK
jgi:hypothetical protein